MPKKSKAEQVLQDNPDAMHDLMQKIRSDPNYITQLYKDCPGMRRVLDEHPDLKKIFENPDIMKQSFEAVYVKNGGEPEPQPDEDDSDYESDTDEDDYESSYGGSNRGKSSYNDGKSLATEDFDDDDTLARQKKALKKKRAAEKAAKDPTKAAQVLSKLAGARGIVIIAMSFMSPFKIVRKLGEVFFEGDIEPPTGDAAIAADACNAAAEHFDDPAVAEEMDRLLEENPDNLDEIVENDEALRNLRDSDPIAAELMRDPETFKVITDGDNLRAMGELTQAMEGDFASGLEGGADAAGSGADAAVTALDAADAAGNVADAADAADAFDAPDAPDADEPDLDDERNEGEEEEGDNYVQDGVEDKMEDKKASRKSARGKGQKNRSGDAAKGAGGLMGAIGAAAAGGILGDAMGDMIPDFGGAEDLAGAGEEMGGLEDAAALEDVGGDAELLDAADAAEAADDGLTTEQLGMMAAAGGGAAAVGAVGGAYVLSRNGKGGEEGTRGQPGGEGDGEEGEDGDADREEGDDNKKGMFGKLKSHVGNAAAFVKDTAKETLITNVLGDDVGEAMLDAQEDLQEEMEKDDEGKDDDATNSQDDDRKDRRRDTKQHQRQQSYSHGRRYEDDWDDGDDWNYDSSRRNNWR
mmetsp:Transcript_16976/g.36955  ORF Transcript_16976/g.36955 Transcript_16976/m.36955 type:complete len:638 (-) Transcript_16976:939-2852(-)